MGRHRVGGVIVIVIVLAIAFPESDEASQSGAPPPPTPTQDSRAANVAYTAWLQDLIGPIGHKSDGTWWFIQ